MVVGLLAGSKCNISLNLLLAKRISIKGTTLRARPLEEKAEISRAFAERVLPYFVSGRLKPVIDQVFSLEQAAAAHQLMEENKNFGKIVLDLERKRA
jgi:NADPH:quinone reductase-like Zn-dependent oxidoreductase